MLKYQREKKKKKEPTDFCVPETMHTPLCSQIEFFGSSNSIQFPSIAYLHRILAVIVIVPN